MGCIAVVISIITGIFYRDSSIDNQRQSMKDILQLVTKNKLDELKEPSLILAYGLSKSAQFIGAFDTANETDLQRYLDSRFAQYLALNGVLTLSKLYFYDKDLQLVAASSNGIATSFSQPVICEGLKRLAQNQKGAEKLKSQHLFCGYDGKAYYSVLVAIGGLSIKGYLQVVVSPIKNLATIANDLGLPIRITYADNQVAYESAQWKGIIASSTAPLIAKHQFNYPTNVHLLTIYSLQDLSLLYAELNKTQLWIVVSTLLLTIIAGMLVLSFLSKTVVQPINALRYDLAYIWENKARSGELIEASAAPEIAELIDDFNQMDVKMKNLYSSLMLEVKERSKAEKKVRLANTELEEKVLARTSELELMKSKAEQANRTKTEFFSSMSHELRTPLNAIIGFSQLIQYNPKEPLSELQNNNITEVLKASEHLLGLINQILDVAKIEEGHIELFLEHIVISEVLKDALDLISPLADKRGIDISINCEGTAVSLAELPGWPNATLADDSRLKQVFINLLSNAVKYNYSNGSIIISCTHHESDLNRISFKDTGPGLTTEQQANLFSAFNRLGIENHETIEGAGIGLFITKTLVELMGGKIGVDSKKGEGCCFWVELKALQSSEKNEQIMDHSTKLTSLTPAISAEQTIGKPKYHVLYIEDNPANLLLVKNILENRSDIHFQGAPDGITGLRIIEQFSPDLVLLDIHLTGMNGFEVLEQIRQSQCNRSMTVFALSANAMQKDIKKGLAAGFDQYLTKPIDIRTLLRAVDMALHGEKCEQ
jgi:signal transduction histidine kinase/CheY-like chemotaxis protein